MCRDRCQRRRSKLDADGSRASPVALIPPPQCPGRTPLTPPRQRNAKALRDGGSRPGPRSVPAQARASARHRAAASHSPHHARHPGGKAATATVLLQPLQAPKQSSPASPLGLVRDEIEAGAIVKIGQGRPRITPHPAGHHPDLRPVNLAAEPVFAGEGENRRQERHPPQARRAAASREAARRQANTQPPNRRARTIPTGPKRPGRPAKTCSAWGKSPRTRDSNQDLGHAPNPSATPILIAGPSTCHRPRDAVAILRTEVRLSERRSRLVPAGTVGGRTAAARMPSSRRASAKVRAASSSSRRTGTIGESPSGDRPAGFGQIRTKAARNPMPRLLSGRPGGGPDPTPPRRPQPRPAEARSSR